MTSDGAAERVSVAKFVAALLAAQTLFGLVLIWLDSIGFVTPSSTGIVGSLAGAAAAGAWFATDHQRAMTPSEKRRFAVWGTIFTILEGVIVFLSLVVAEIGAEQTVVFAKATLADAMAKPGAAAVFGGILVFTILLSYALYYYFAGSFSKKLAARHVSQDRIPPTL